MEANDQLVHQLEKVLLSLSAYWPEFIIFGGLVITLLADLIFLKKEDTTNWWLGIIPLIALLVAIIKQISIFDVSHGFGDFMKLVILVSGVLFSLFSITQTTRVRKIGEYHILFGGILIGALLLTQSTNLLIIYLGIELMSISAYVLTGFLFSKQSSEASLKYLLFGAVSSAIMLFGISLLYGFTQSFDISNYDLFLTANTIGAVPVKLALFMLLFGFLFKMAAAPLHIWSPDVYQAAPTFVVAAFSVIPKLAVFTLIINISSQLLVFSEVRLMLIIAAFFSLIIGNFGALWQTNAKRMIAYSSIAHSGFLLIAFFAGVENFVFYGMVYLVMNFAVFGLVQIVENKYGIVEMAGYKGLGKKIPVIGVLFVLVLISLTGLPPTAGFTAKLLIFSGIWEMYLSTDEVMYLLLFLFGLLNAVVSLFYYLRIPYYMFIKNEEATLSKENKSPLLLNFFSLMLVFLLLLGFFIPSGLMDMIYSINFAQ